jgi:hypothetical protein
MVTNVILVTSPNDGGGDPENLHTGTSGNVAVFNSLLQTLYNASLSRVDIYAGGPKSFEVDMFIGAFKDLDVGKLVIEFNRIKWDYPISACLMFKDEDDDQFVLFQAAAQKKKKKEGL